MSDTTVFSWTWTDADGGKIRTPFRMTVGEADAVDAVVLAMSQEHSKCPTCKSPPGYGCIGKPDGELHQKRRVALLSSVSGTAFGRPSRATLMREGAMALTHDVEQVGSMITVRDDCTAVVLAKLASLRGVPLRVLLAEILADAAEKVRKADPFTAAWVELTAEPADVA